MSATCCSEHGLKAIVATIAVIAATALFSFLLYIIYTKLNGFMLFLFLVIVLFIVGSAVSKNRK
jgi:intracellular septation protein A